MQLTFNRFPRNLAGFVSCMAIALAASAGVEARGAITYDSDSNRTLTQMLSSSFVVDLNSECHVLPVAGMEDQERAEMPCLSSEELDCIASLRASEPGDFSDTNAADDGDYLEYKYGRYGRNVGGNSNLNSSPSQSTDDASVEDFSTQADDPSNADNISAANEYPWQDTINDGSDNDPGMTPGYEKYYRYHYMSVEEQVGRNEGPTAQGDDDETTNPKEGAEEEDEGDDSQMADDTSDDDASESGVFADAMLSIVLDMADEWSGRYGMKISDVGRLLGIKN